MNIKTIEQNGVQIAVVESEELLITDLQSALDLLMSVSYHSGCNRMVLDKKNICDDFFILSTTLAGDVLQKYINYQMKVAIFGDYSVYTSKPLHDFIRESNRGKDFFFVATAQEGIEKLAQAN